MQTRDTGIRRFRMNTAMAWGILGAVIMLILGYIIKFAQELFSQISHNIKARKLKRKR